MNYELAKQLKEAGWPQTKEFYTELEYCTSDNEIRSTHPGDAIPHDCYYVPTLSELIEACGGDIEKVGQKIEKGVPIGWIATSFLEHYLKFGTRDMIYKTPEEAVANLWLKLNESKQG